MRLALFQPEIAGNVGAVIRTCAAFGVSLDIIDPCGFPFSDRSLARSGMDYIERALITRHSDWAAFQAGAHNRIILLTTKATTPLHCFAFEADDILLLGQESSGVPDAVRRSCAGEVRIAMAPGIRSFNLSVSAGVALHEALRQTGGLRPIIDHDYGSSSAGQPPLG